MRSRAMRTLVVVLTAVIKLMAQAKSPTSEGDYVGSEVCITCHADQGKHFQSTIMGKAFAHAKNDREKLGCEACHGPGRVHVTSGGGKDTIPIRFTKDSMNTVEERNDACLSCHSRGNRVPRRSLNGELNRASEDCLRLCGS